MKQQAPATERNRIPILAELQWWLPRVSDAGSPGIVLEIASGTGQHAAFFAAQLPEQQWQPTAPNPVELASIEAYRADAGAGNLLPAERLDVLERPWPVRHADVVVCINMIHITPWACTEALFAGAADVVPVGGLVILYGPFQVDGAHTAPSNEIFDGWLKGQDPAYGVRDLAAVNAVAWSAGFAEVARTPMPANNFVVVWRRAPPE